MDAIYVWWNEGGMVWYYATYTNEFPPSEYDEFVSAITATFGWGEK